MVNLNIAISNIENQNMVNLNMENLNMHNHNKDLFVAQWLSPTLNKILHKIQKTETILFKIYKRITRKKI
jgi:hypothetical protein